MKGRIRINAQLCKGCRYCIITCPKNVIALGGKFNRSGYYPALPANMSDCTGCALCAEICPEIAIEVWRTKAPKAPALKTPPGKAAKSRR